MSTFILPAGYVHFAIFWRNSNSPKIALVTIAAKVDTPPFTELDADTFYTTFVNSVKGIYDSSNTWPQMVTLVGSDGEPGRFVTTGVLAGTHAGYEDLPANVAAIIQKQSGLAGRRNRGRMYFPYLDETRVDQSGRLGASYQTDFQTAADAIYTVMTPLGSANLETPVLLHSEAPTTPTVVTSLTVSPIVATQRRRLVRATM